MGNSEQGKDPSGRAHKLLDKFNRKELGAKGIEGLKEHVLLLEKKLEKATKRADDLEKDNEIQKQRIKELESANKPLFKYQGYDKSKGWVYKLCFILERNGQKMTLQEIKKVCLSLEPDLDDRWINIDHYLAQILYSASIRGAVIKTKSKTERGYYYEFSG